MWADDYMEYSGNWSIIIYNDNKLINEAYKMVIQMEIIHLLYIEYIKMETLRTFRWSQNKFYYYYS